MRSAIILVFSSVAMAVEPSFNAQVRPILSDKCYACHGPDTANNKAELRLDLPDEAYRKQSESGLRAIVPGDLKASHAWQRILSKDPEEVMPPPNSHLSLSDEEKDVLRRWILAGARYEKHWAFVPLPAVVEVPAVRDAAWPSGPMDAFVLSRLENERLKPSPDAPALRWLRRVSLDLTGLPPSPDLIRRFESASAEGLQKAREMVVDELLASPAYGEHMAVAWLDAARYADSYGYQSDQLNTQWPYRDWVVRAFNTNLSFDRFATWQLAGDLLPDATREQKLATAFSRLHRLTNEGGSIPAEWLAENAADRVHTFGTTFLALTFECARCHDHKYDPLPTRDYYQLTAFFNSIDENGLYDRADKVPSPTLLLPTPEQQSAWDEARRQLVLAEQKHAEVIAASQSRFEAWLAAGRSVEEMPDVEGRYGFDRADKNEAANEALASKGRAAKLEGTVTEARGDGQALVFDGDRAVSISGCLDIDRWSPFSLAFDLNDRDRPTGPVVVLSKTHGTDVGFNGFDVMLDGGHLEVRLYRVWPGNGLGVRVKEAIPQGQWRHVAVTYDGSSRASGLKVYVDGRPVAVEVLRDRVVKRVMQKGFGNGELRLGARFRDRGFSGGRFDNLWVVGRELSPPELSALAGGPSLAEWMAKGVDRDALREHFQLAVDPACRESSKQLEAARRAVVQAEDAIHEIPVMEELPKPRETHVLARGAYDAPKDQSTLVGRNVPAALPPLQARGPVADRLDLAQWLTQPDHPLTARVFVNRLWSNFFGRGLVATSDNFGLQGSLPSHPQLLDWLARDFVDHGWDIKRLCRNIALSRVYGQDSAMRPELQEKDPDNLLLARGPSHRLSAEQIRDLALSASGLLDAAAGGPPVAPYQPGKDLWRESNSMSPAYKQSTGKALYRRSLYSVWKRTAPLPNMVAFDAGSREVCSVQRGRTNTPMQALVMLNDVQFVEAARVLAERVHDADVAKEIRNAFLWVAGRQPRDAEMQVLVRLHADQLARFRQDPDAAKQWISHGEKPPATNLPSDHLAASTSVCLAILNLDAAIWKR